MTPAPWVSCYERVHDVIICGGGYAGLAAALQLVREGREVLLLERHGDLLWESGRCFAPVAGELTEPLWQELGAEMADRGGLAQGAIDGAIAEVTATDRLLTEGIEALYYAWPVAAETAADGSLTSVIVATKNGLQRLVAHTWIDASESGELLQLCGGSNTRRMPDRLGVYAYLQQAEWPEAPEAHLTLASGGAIQLARTPWEHERCLHIDLPASTIDATQTLIPALRLARETWPHQLERAAVSHASYYAYPIYTKRHRPTSTSCSNLYPASPSSTDQPIRTLADRFGLGLAAATLAVPAEAATETQDLVDLLTQPLPEITPLSSQSTGLVIAGAGTAGAVAAIAAGRAGTRTTCVDPLYLPGGMGTGGGLPWYCFGATGGLQDEIDDRLAELEPLFAPAGHLLGYSLIAKRLVLEQMMRDAGVEWIPNALLCAAQTQDGRVTSADCAVVGGLLRLEASAWIDATGDGDLCALAGVPFRQGRVGDLRMQPYTQVSRRLERVSIQGHDVLRSRMNGSDHGWVDPTDSEDLTRARVLGIVSWLRGRYEVETRPLWFAPAIGLRDGRLIDTDYLLTLDDLVDRNTFDDVIGYTGGFIDNHTVDMEFESAAETAWVWLLASAVTSTACELPYRILLPEGLTNVWIACRAAGMTTETQRHLRMMRDMHRMGEAAALAASMAISAGVGSRQIDLPALQARLRKSGALDPQALDAERPYRGRYIPSEELDIARWRPTLEKGAARLREGQPSAQIWALYRQPHQARALALEALESPDTDVSWLAASLLASWGDATAEPRLLRAIESREGRGNKEGLWPESVMRREPFRRRGAPARWLQAALLLRHCGTKRCLGALQNLANEPNPALHAATTIALTIESLALRGIVDAREAKPLLDRLAATQAPTWAQQNRGPVLLEGLFDRDAGWEFLFAETSARDRRVAAKEPIPLYENLRWHLDLAIGRARLALDRDTSEIQHRYAGDARATVRRAFRILLDQR